VHSAKANKVSNDFPDDLQALELFLKYTSDLTGYPVLLSQKGRLSKMAHHLSTAPLCYSTVLKQECSHDDNSSSPSPCRKIQQQLYEDK